MSQDNTVPILDSRASPKLNKMKDKYHLTYIVFYFLGTISMITHHFFTTANDYWMYKFRDVNNGSSNPSSNPENRTKLQASFTSNFSIISNIVSVLILVVTVKFTQKMGIIPTLIGCFSALMACFTITIIFAGIDTDNWQRGFYIFTLITGAFLAASSSTYLVTIFRLSSRFPHEYILPVLSGQSICGIFSALVQIVSLSVNAGSIGSAFIYFGIGLFCICATFVVFLLTFFKSTFFKYNLNKEFEGPKVKFSKEIIIDTLKKIKFYLMGMVVLLGSTVMLHPAVTSLVVSTGKGSGNRWDEVFFVPTTTFLFFNLFDFVGRETSIKVKKPSNGLVLFIIGIIRLVFIPLIMFSNVQPRHHTSVLLNSNASYTILIILFAFSNGYFVNLCIMNVNTVCGEEQKAVSLVIIVLVMITSLGLCNFFSMVILGLV